MKQDELFQMQHEVWKNRKPVKVKGDPIEGVAQPPTDGMLLEAKQKVDDGKVACVVLAGGMGTRLGVPGPKGCVKLPAYDNQSLFDVVLSKAQGMQVAVMCSPQNFHETTKALVEAPCTVICQSQMPLLDKDGQWIMDEGEPVMGPDGNAGVFAALEKEGVLDTWSKLGVEYINVVPIDNPKADPRSSLQIAALQDVELAVVAIEPSDGTGILIEEGGKLTVAEYSETTLGGSYAYSGLFSVSMDFASRCGRTDMDQLPWHLAEKETRGQQVYKFERFIFDWFRFAKSYRVVFQPREICFAPIKHKEDIE